MISFGSGGIYKGGVYISKIVNEGRIYFTLKKLCVKMQIFVFGVNELT